MNSTDKLAETDVTAGERLYTLGGRTYTSAQYERLARENKAAAGPLLITVGAAVVFAAIVALVFGLSDWRLEGNWLLVAGIVMAIVPAAILAGGFLHSGSP